MFAILVMRLWLRLNKSKEEMTCPIIASRSSQCSTTGVTKAVVCVILSEYQWSLSCVIDHTHTHTHTHTEGMKKHHTLLWQFKKYILRHQFVWFCCWNQMESKLLNQLLTSLYHYLVMWTNLTKKKKSILLIRLVPANIVIFNI